MIPATFSELRDTLTGMISEADVRDAAAAVFAPQATDLLFLGNHGDLAFRLATARQMRRDGIDTSGTEAAIIQAFHNGDRQ